MTHHLHPPTSQVRGLLGLGHITVTPVSYIHVCVSSSKSSDHPRIVLPDGGSEADPESDGL